MTMLIVRNLIFLIDRCISANLPELATRCLNVPLYGANWSALRPILNPNINHLFFLSTMLSRAARPTSAALRGLRTVVAFESRATSLPSLPCTSVPAARRSVHSSGPSNAAASATAVKENPKSSFAQAVKHNYVSPTPPDHEDIREAVRALCANFPGTYWRETDRNRAYPTEFVKALTDAGWLACLIPEEYGGSGLSLSAAAVLMEEIQRSGCNGSAAHAQVRWLSFRHRLLKDRNV